MRACVQARDAIVQALCVLRTFYVPNESIVCGNYASRNDLSGDNIKQYQFHLCVRSKGFLHRLRLVSLNLIARYMY
jgi:hypothetical protein